MVDVVKNVTTMMDLITAPVEVAMSWLMTIKPVQVNSMILSAYGYITISITWSITIAMYVIFCWFYLDIDECKFNNGGCEHNCTNNNGSFFCTCLVGYKFKKDNLSCAGMLALVQVSGS